MRLRVFHRTEYRYSKPVSHSCNELRLTPINRQWQSCESNKITARPAAEFSRYEDLNVNTVYYFEVPDAHRRLVIESRSVVVTQPKVDPDDLPYGFLHKDIAKCRAVEGCHSFLQSSHYIKLTPAAWRMALDIKADSQDVFGTAHAIMAHIFKQFQYKAGTTSVSTHASEVLRKRTGVCQDFAHAMVVLCRSLAIPARYVSGYFFDATRDHRLRGSEASHAWVEVYIDTFGWVGLDPTNNKVVDDTYIVLARGRDYRDVAPVIGSYFGKGRSAMTVNVTVECLD